MLRIKRFFEFFEDQKPTNYRETPFKFGPKDNAVVVALARPDYCGQNPLEVMRYLKNHHVQTIFGLDTCPAFATIAKSLGLQYCDFSIPDFSAPEMSLYDKIFDTIMEQVGAGKRVAIHCRGGIGRTGTVLAAMKLKELAQNESFYECDDIKDCTINLPYQFEPTNCTKNVRDAILAIRTVPGSEDAVEVEEQIQGLCEYDSFLRKNRTKQHDEESKIQTNTNT